MDDDMLIKAGIIGALATVLSEIASRILLFIGFSKYSVYQLNSLIVTLTRPSTIIGLIVNFIVGSLLSAMLYIAFKKWGSGYIIIKCIMVSLFTWLLWEMIFTISIEGKILDLRPISDYYSHLICTFVYGASMGILLKYCIFNKKKFN